MSEIIGIHIGGFGTRIGVKFWEQLKKQKIEDNLNQQSQIESPHIFFHEKQKKDEMACRSILVDTDPRVNIYFGNCNLALEPHMIVSSQGSTSNIFAEGKYKSGAFLIDQFMDSLRKQAQKCERLSGFILSNSFGGGCGSGLTAHLLQKLLQDHRYKIVENFGLLPEYEDYPVNPLEVYNTVLTTHYHIQYSNLDVVFQNSAVQNYLFSKKTCHPTIQETNDRIVQGMLQHTAPYRYPGHINTNQRKRAVNLVMFPRLKLVIPSLSQKWESNYVESTFDIINRFIKIKNLSRVYASLLNVRDPFAFQNQIDLKLKSLVPKYGTPTQWLPCLYGVSITKNVNQQTGPSAWNLFNCSAVTEPIKALCELFTAQFRRKAFLDHYCSLGMDQMEFTQAQSNCNDILSQYIPCCGCCYDEQDYDQSQI